MSRASILWVPFLAFTVQACGGTAPPPAKAPDSPAFQAITTPASLAPTVAAPANVDALCAKFGVSGGLSWKEQLDSTRKLEPILEQGFKDVGAASGADCVKQAALLQDQVERRYNVTRTLCDLRARDGGISSAAFKAASADLRSSMNEAFDAALKAPATCTKNVAEARAEYRKLLARANDTCSPPSDDALAACDDQVQTACDEYAAGKAQGATVVQALACTAPASGRGIAGARDASASREPGARTPLAGGALQTAIISGAADFFVERAEQEMSLFAAEVLGRRLCAKDSPALPYLPKTCDLLNPDSPDPVIGATPSALRAAAKADLERLPDFAVAEIAKQDTNVACAVAFAWGTTEEIAHGADLSELLKDLKPVLEKPLVKQHCEKFKDALSALGEHVKLQLLGGDRGFGGESLRSANLERRVGSDPTLTEQEKKVIQEVLRRLLALDRAVTTYHEHPSPEARIDMTLAAVQVLVPIMIYVAPKAEADVHTSIALFSQVLNKDYAGAIVTASQLSAQFLPPKARNALSLAAGLAQAQSSDDVRQTLKDAALPLGSWRRKNEARIGATLTGMVGFGFGYEQVLQKPTPTREVSNGWSMAPTLMVGVDIHGGLSKNWRLGLHMNLLDLGALASIRTDKPKVKDTTTNQTVTDDMDVSAKASPEVRVEQVFAPGIFPYVGIGPFDLGPALTFVPSLRPSENAGKIEPLDVFRYGFVVAVDVSVLPLL